MVQEHSKYMWSIYLHVIGLNLNLVDHYCVLYKM